MECRITVLHFVVFLDALKVAEDYLAVCPRGAYLIAAHF